MAMPVKSSITTEQELLFWLICQNNPKVVELTATDMTVGAVTVETGDHNTKAVVTFTGGAEEFVNFNRVAVTEVGTMEPFETNSEGWTEENLKATATSRASVWFAGKKIITPAFGAATVTVTGGGELKDATEVTVTLPIDSKSLQLIGAMEIKITKQREVWIAEPNLTGFTVGQLTIE